MRNRVTQKMKIGFACILKLLTYCSSEGNHGANCITWILELLAKADLEQTRSFLERNNSASVRKWRHCSSLQYRMLWAWQYSTAPRLQQTVQVTVISYFILLNQKNSLRIHSSINPNCSLTARQQVNPAVSSGCKSSDCDSCDDTLSADPRLQFPPWTTISTVEEWQIK